MLMILSLSTNKLTNISAALLGRFAILKPRCSYTSWRSPTGLCVSKAFRTVKLEEARLKAEAEAQLKAEEEARLEAEEETLQKAEEEACLQAEEEARLKAEEEALRIAEEEARLKAEAEDQ
jgi:hypothetical protein